jgi:hypothetical protein
MTYDTGPVDDTPDATIPAPRPVEPFPPDDPLAYNELTPEMLAWRVALAALADSGGVAAIPVDLMPSYVPIEVAAGWRLRLRVDADAERRMVLLSAQWADWPRPGDDDRLLSCAGPQLAADRGRTNDVACDGAVRWAVTALSGVVPGHSVAGPFGPLCNAHCDVEQRRITAAGYPVNMINLRMVRGMLTQVVRREPHGEWFPPGHAFTPGDDGGCSHGGCDTNRPVPS